VWLCRARFRRGRGGAANFGASEGAHDVNGFGTTVALDTWVYPASVIRAVSVNYANVLERADTIPPSAKPPMIPMVQMTDRLKARTATR
jgi:hypothetical protein